MKLVAESSHFLFRYGPRLLVILAAVHLFHRLYKAAKRRPRRLQFGLGAVLGTVVVLAVAIAWLNAWYFAPIELSATPRTPYGG